MSIKHELHLAYVLHARPFKETSLLLEMFSQEHGRISLVARGAKRGKFKTSSILQPFIPLMISWYGVGELVTLTHVEPIGLASSLHGKRAICGLYINELLIRLLHKWDPCLKLFFEYRQILHKLSDPSECEQVSLRKFEKQLLASMGYALQLTKEIVSGQKVSADQYYLFDPVLGPKLIDRSYPGAVKGQSLLALASENFLLPEVLQDIKYLMRSVFSYHLGARPLMARQLL